MTSASVKAALRDHLDDELGTDGPPQRRPNETFDPQGQPWVELRFPGAHTERGDIGETQAPLWDEAGAFMVDVNVPADIGEDSVSALADQIWNIFKGEPIPGIRCDTRLQGSAGPRDDTGAAGVWYGLSFGVGYRYLHIDS
jgi:hypothetical protein